MLVCLYVLFATHLRRQQIKQSIAITVELMIDFKGFFNQMTTNFITFFNMFFGWQRGVLQF